MPTFWWNPFPPAPKAAEPPADTGPKPVVIDLRDGREPAVLTATALEAYRTLNRHAELSLIEGYPGDEDDVVGRAVATLLF